MKKKDFDYTQAGRFNLSTNLNGTKSRINKCCESSNKPAWAGLSHAFVLHQPEGRLESDFGKLLLTKTHSGLNGLQRDISKTKTFGKLPLPLAALAHGKGINIWWDPWLNGHGLKHYLGRISYIWGPPASASLNILINNGSWHKPPRWPTSLDGLWNNISELDVGSVGEDVLIWSPSKFGDLTLSSAWNFLRPALPSSPMWSTWVWLSSQTPRHSLCLWQAFQDKLPTCTRLLRKGLISNASCLLCRSGTEDADHFFLNCSFSRYIFRALMKGLLIASPIPRSFENLPQWLTTVVACPIKKSLIQISLSIFCWHVWMERNSRIFSGKSNHKGLLLRQIKADITRRCCSLSLKAVRSPDILKIGTFFSISISEITSSPTLVRWVPPQLGWIKLNSDGSLSEDRGGYGALLRTHEADFIYGIAGRIDLPSINLLELKASEEGLWLAIRLNFPSIRIETDSTTACAWVLGKGSHSWSSIRSLRHIHQGLLLLQDWKITHIHREGNSPADILASFQSARGVTIIPPSQLWHELRTTLELDKVEEDWQVETIGRRQVLRARPA
ncbi:hypothetical protein QJS10_CPA01g01653 [Acorus calamus]|uniref:RNase H type-1 domain-containing protein n=1 Tax=Acorus calamus TaxID=4465 RepID=A0AAV9FFV5_ACOCL|nr:hypothetical protein QJS10_CPA01g01653 [Acorus calamus]